MTEPQPPLEPFALPDYEAPATLFEVLVASASRRRHKTAFIYLAGEEECRVTYGKLFEDVLLLALHGDYIKGCRQFKGVFVIGAPELHTLFSHVYSYTDLLADRRFTDDDFQRFHQRGGGGDHGRGPADRHLHLGDHRSAEGGDAEPCQHHAQDLEKYRPTLVAIVPRVWESLYSRVQAGVKKKGRLASGLFAAMVRVSAAYRRYRRRYLGRFPVYAPEPWWRALQRRVPALAGMIVLYPLYKLAMKKLALVQQRFGGRLRLAISGGGTLATYLEEWIDAVGIRIVNAYGMTECSPSIAGRGLNCRVYGTVGPPVPLTEIRIASEEGEILPPGREGLIEVRGPQVTRGYYRDEEETARSFTEDGFFRTGDLGRMTLSGELVITGRAKVIIVLASGENIDPTRIENAISMFPFIQDAVLVGQDKKGLGALLIPNIDELREYARQRFSDLKEEGEELLTNSRVLDHIRHEMNRLLHPRQGFKSYEKLQGIAFLAKEFKLGEELTNTLKKKRHVIEQKYRQVINDLLH